MSRTTRKLLVVSVTLVLVMVVALGFNAAWVGAEPPVKNPAAGVTSGGPKKPVRSQNAPGPSSPTVQGVFSVTSGDAVLATTTDANGTAVNATGGYVGMYGTSTHIAGNGVWGYATGNSPLAYGVWGASEHGPAIVGDGMRDHGVVGNSYTTTVGYAGVYGASSSTWGVYGTTTSSNAASAGAYGYSAGTHGLYGSSTDGTGVGSWSTNGFGYYGGSSNGTGILGQSATGANGSAGVWGKYDGPNLGYGIRGTAPANGYAGWFDGTVRVNGPLIVTGAKTGYVAEIAQAAPGKDLRAGDVVVLAGEAPPTVGQIPTPLVSTTDSQAAKRVIGVVAGPVSEGDPSLLVVTYGAFSTVNVDASFGAISIGDLLVTSPNAGYAMRSDSPAPGTAIGKAIGSLESGTGQISVMVTLQ